MSSKHFKYKDVISDRDEKLVFGYIREQCSTVNVPISLKQLCALFSVEFEQWDEEFTYSDFEIFGSNNDLIIKTPGWQSLVAAVGSIVIDKGRHHWRFKIIRLRTNSSWGIADRDKCLSVGVVENKTKMELATIAKTRGNNHFDQQQWDQAIAEYTKAIQLNDEEHTYYSNRSACYAVTNQLQKALVDGKKCVELQPLWVKGYGRIGYALFKLGKIGEATKAYEDGLKIDPNNPMLTDGLEKCKDAINAMNRPWPIAMNGGGWSYWSNINPLMKNGAYGAMLANSYLCDIANNVEKGTIIDMLLDLQSAKKKLIVSYKDEQIISMKDLPLRAYRMAISMPNNQTCVKLLSYHNYYDPKGFLLSSISMNK